MAGNRQKRQKGSGSPRAQLQHPVNQGRRQHASRSTRAKLHCPVNQRTGHVSCSPGAELQYPVNQRTGQHVSCSTRAEIQYPVNERTGQHVSRSPRAELEYPVNQRRRHVSRSTRAELQFPVSRIDRFLRQGNYSQRLSSTSPVFLAGVLQHVTSNILELAGEVAHSSGKKRIAPEHLYRVLQDNVQLKQLLKEDTKSVGDQIGDHEDN